MQILNVYLLIISLGFLVYFIILDKFEVDELIELTKDMYFIYNLGR